MPCGTWWPSPSRPWRTTASRLSFSTSEEPVDSSRRRRRLAHLSLHVSMAAEPREFAMRGVVAFAIETVETVENDAK